MVSLLDAVLFPTYFFLLFLTIFWLLTLFSKDTRDEKPKKLTRFPKFSVIIPAYNEEKSIAGTIKSVLKLDYPKNKIDVVIVNDGSSDGTRKIVEDIIAKNPTHNIKLINQKNQGKGRAMNVGLKHIKGEFFACLDADSFVGSDALQIMLPLFEDKSVGAVCPLLKVEKPGSVLQKVQWSEYIINMFYRYLNAKLDCIHVTPGPFSAYRTKVIRDLGGYDETTITEDLEIAIRLQKHNYRILQTFDTVVTTVAPNSWKALFRQRVRWYKGGVDNTINYRKLMFNRKYGDFGMIRMPTIVASGVVALILTGALLHALISRAYRMFIGLKDVNFDFLTLLSDINLNFNPLTLPFFKIIIAGTLIGLSLLVMYLSFKVVRENITNYGKTWTMLFTYLAIYGLFLTTVWIYIAYMFVARKNNFWK